jgi:hypothetical protein
MAQNEIKISLKSHILIMKLSVSRGDYSKMYELFKSSYDKKIFCEIAEF